MTEMVQNMLCDGVQFSSIHDERFKTGRVSATLLLPLKRETATANGILPYLLRRCCRAYPSFTQMNQKLSELYGASLYADVRKIGEAQALSIAAVGIDDRYSLEGESVSQQLAQLLCDLLFDPALEDGAFRQEDIEQERRQLIDLIDSEYNDKRTYARQRCEQLMCENEAFGVSRFGTREQVERLTAGEIAEAWQNALKTARVELMMLGSSDPLRASEGFQKAFAGLKRAKPADCPTQVIPSAQKVRAFHDQMEVAQAKLVLGFRAGTAAPDEGVMAARLMSALYGGTPHSKLFLNVREKMSLCYYCSSRYDRNKGLLLVESGVEQQNIEKAKKEILRQLEQVQQGRFDDSEIEAAKMSSANSFRTMADYQGGLEYWYLSQIFDGRLQSPEEAAQEICGVTREQIVEAAKKVTLDTVYTLTGKEEQA